jgi:hypothetical protein
MPPPKSITAAICLGLTLVSSSAAASEYCTKEQYESDVALIKGAINAGTIVKGPATLRDSILVQESMWFGMNYPKQIAFMQSFDCANGGPSGKHVLYVDVRSLATGRLLANWFAGALKPTEEPHDQPNPGMKPTEEPHDLTNPGTSQGMEDENRIGLTGEARAAFINSAIDNCKTASSAYCSCYANAMADSVTIKELKDLSIPGNREAGMIALRPKIDAAAKRCLTN